MPVCCRALGVFVVGVVAMRCAAAAVDQPLSVEFVESLPTPGAVLDQNGQPLDVTGLSGVTWIGGDSYAAAMDKSDKLVLFELSFAPDGSVIDASGFRGLTLAAVGDHEGIAATGAGTVLVADESTMAVREFSLDDGALLGEISTPDVFHARRNNLGLESLAFDPEFSWTANEEALVVDGGRASPDEGTVVRLLRFEAASGVPRSQHAYVVEPMHGPRFPFGNPGQSGLSDLVALPDGRVLALERSLALAAPLFLTRIFELEFAAADDVSRSDGLIGTAFEPVGKRLRYAGGHDNLEGLCLGPRLAPRLYALVGVVDDGDPVSENEIVVFTLRGLEVCSADVDGDGAVDVDDLYMLHRDPEDLNGDGAADAGDRSCLTAYLRRHEYWDQRDGRRP